MFQNFRKWFQRQPLTAVSVRVDDSAGWSGMTARPQDYDAGRVQEIYADALEAWRKNPIAWRIIAITSDYVVGRAITITSPRRELNRFIEEFWNHPKNHMPLRLESMCDELSRAGDLFVLLFRNPQDGMSYIRFVTKDHILKIETAENDWETELVYHERADMSLGSRIWLSPQHPDAANADAICLHYAINRPLGAILGESDLTTMLPWLLRYSRLLEDRVRLHWALRAFLWLVTVPSNRVREKQEFYRTPPDSGSLVIKDESEKWEMLTPNLHGADARHDMQAVRAMIDAGAGYPPHWRGDASDISLATAQAMQGPTERHLIRRQRYFVYLLEDILYHAYQRYLEALPAPAGRDGRRRLPQAYERLFTAQFSDISSLDNEALARAARDISNALTSLADGLHRFPPSLASHALRLAFKFAGEPLTQQALEQILAEFQNAK